MTLTALIQAFVSCKEQVGQPPDTSRVLRKSSPGLMENFQGANTPAKKGCETVSVQEQLFSPVAPFTPLQPASSGESEVCAAPST